MRSTRSATVVKIGGSLVADAGRLRALLAGLAVGDRGPCIVVPGGGPLADAVRVTQRALGQRTPGMSDALAHRLALDAMGHMAEILSELEPRLVVARDMAAIAAGLAAGRVPIWNPVALKEGHPAIPETWRVTSDSLAVWLATTLQAPLCLLVKSADRPAVMSWADLARVGFVDAAFPAFAARYAGDIAILGPRTDQAGAAAETVA
ncbi:uridylate kinase [Methylobacterium sp. J-068]|uniref:amino acid kinase family protein n=1 Tax=Methylobacterium sp. J-068 TaxID=2836649 RepID=UPI001FBA13B1|nr:uridylate kinase [Methylobacterium sp. J-068]MCJ2034985.1 uridylate kinase [Methylobacterium sp. J-068]